MKKSSTIALFLAVPLISIAIFIYFYFEYRSEYLKKNDSGKRNLAKDGMVLIPEGYFLMGKDRDDGAQDETPVHRVWVDAFLIERYEVTNSQYAKFVEESGYRPVGPWYLYSSLERNTHPVVAITWNDAASYAIWYGKRLPSEAEWEKAARAGKISEPYPWSKNELRNNGCCYENEKKGDGIPPTYPVGSFKPNGYGIYDMHGNVYEWCADWYEASYYSTSPEKNPLGAPTGLQKVIRGGSWASTNWLIRAAHRGRINPKLWATDIGFRCAQDVITKHVR